MVRHFLFAAHMADLESEIESVGQGPAAVSGDAGSMRQHPIRDLIEADKYLKSLAATSAKTLGIRMTKIVPPGSV